LLTLFKQSSSTIDWKLKQGKWPTFKETYNGMTYENEWCGTAQSNQFGDKQSQSSIIQKDFIFMRYTSRHLRFTLVFPLSRAGPRTGHAATSRASSTGDPTTSLADYVARFWYFLLLPENASFP
jgi:hypothetical protein